MTCCLWRVEMLNNLSSLIFGGLYAIADRRRLRWVEILKIEGLGFLNPLWRIDVASGGRKLHQMKILDLLSLYGGSSMLLAGRNPQKMKLLVF